MFLASSCNSQDDQNSPDARRRGGPTEAYASYAAGRAARANEADGLFSSSCSELDLDVDAGGKVQLHERVDRLRRRVDDIEQALVRPHLELLARRVVDVRAS